MTPKLHIILILTPPFNFDTVQNTVDSWVKGIHEKYPKTKGQSLCGEANHYFDPTMWTGSFAWFPPLYVNDLRKAFNAADEWPEILVKEDEREGFFVFDELYLERAGYIR